MFNRKEYYKEYNKTHREQRLAQYKKYNSTHKEQRKKYNKEYQKTHKEYLKQYFIKYKYGLSKTEYDNLLLSQNNRCAICKEPLDSQNPHNVIIDHNHLTGKIRGILCRKCNLAIGQLRDNPEYAYNAFLYLKEND